MIISVTLLHSDGTILAFLSAIGLKSKPLLEGLYHLGKQTESLK